MLEDEALNEDEENSYGQENLIAEALGIDLEARQRSYTSGGANGKVKNNRLLEALIDSESDLENKSNKNS